MKSREAEKRLFTDVWICRKCKAKNRSSKNKSPRKCRKCSTTDLRLKRKVAKSKA